MIILSSVLLILVTLFSPKNPILLTLAMIPYGAGFIWMQTPYVKEIMNLVPECKGIVASILTSLRLLITAGVLEIVASNYNNTIIPTTISIFLISIIIIIVYVSYEHKFKIQFFS